jgi:putative membrane protein
VLDLILAILHHIAVFGLVATLAMEGLALRAPVIDLPRLVKLDARFGMMAGLVVVIGVSRVVWGGKGWAFYEANPFFWGKIGLFVVIGLISILPTGAFIRWRRAAAGNPTYAPPADELKRARMWVGLEALLLAPLLASAAAMARWPF